jgi:hypothetical protein
MAPEENQDTPEETTPDTPEVEAPESDQTDIPDGYIPQGRYDDLRTEFDRRNQVFAALEGTLGPEAQEQAFAIFGAEFAEDDDEDYDEEDSEDEDGDEPMTRAEFEEYLSEQDAEAEEYEADVAFKQDLNEVLESIEKDEGRTLSDQETRVLLREAEAQVAEYGTFDLTDSWEGIREWSKAEIDRYVKSKQEATLAPLGSAGDQKIDFNDEDARRDQMAKIMEADSQRQAEES